VYFHWFRSLQLTQPSLLNDLHAKYNVDSGCLDEEELNRRMVLSNIIEQIRHVEQSSKAGSAIQDRGLKVHGIVYDASSKRGYRLYQVGTHQLE
jgi:carbonic anhydrase